MCILMGNRSKCLYYGVLTFFNLEKSENPGKMQPHVAIYLGVHCLPKCMFTGIQNEKRSLIVIVFK